MDDFLKRFHYCINFIDLCLWIVGIGSVLLFRILEIENGTLFFTIFSKFFEITMVRVFFIPVEPILLLIILMRDIYHRTSWREVWRTIVVFLLNLILGFAYLGFFISSTGI